MRSKKRFQKKKFSTFVKWLGKTRARFYTGLLSKTCPLAKFAGISVGVPDDVLIDPPINLVFMFDIGKPTTGQEALELLREAGLITL